VRKDLKKAAEHFGIALSHMEKIVKDDNIPKEVKGKVGNIIKKSSVYIDELNKLREIRVI